MGGEDIISEREVIIVSLFMSISVCKLVILQAFADSDVRVS